MLIILFVVILVIVLTQANRGKGSTPAPANMGYMAMPDFPSGMFFRSRWIVVRTKEEEKVVSALGFKGISRVSWRKGVSVAAQGGVFVAPEVDNWTVACGLGLPVPATVENINLIKQLLIRLSEEHGEAQFFCSDTSAGLHCWMRAEKGVMTRTYSLNLAAGTNALQEGEITEAERPFLYAMANTGPGQMQDGFQMPSREEIVMRVAQGWGSDFRRLGARLESYSVFGWLGQMNA